MTSNMEEQIEFTRKQGVKMVQISTTASGQSHVVYGLGSDGLVYRHVEEGFLKNNNPPGWYPIYDDVFFDGRGGSN